MGAGGTLGMLGGLYFGRTRAGKALRNVLAKPGNQLAFARAGQWVGNSLADLVSGPAPASVPLLSRQLLPEPTLSFTPALAQSESEPEWLTGRPSGTTLGALVTGARR